ncbi:diaminobutyrate acetyltransferase [Streptomyces albipurpureus]|uniref:L-2,4-diaminobutyric acid acetyltransferase n=1 Tax=Streptomyces albipurpureus TaxID=2897419 RepID=A0ABT0USI6_9ACTN|nr:diaminobutyrate acetyltransferase [Streptomyces sp. CWNU-1]MCM2391518.1 diaminobutyrate acetyltransferase [Streptomyces sp. CWNU-1]
MTAAQEDLVRATPSSEFITVEPPRVEDGAALWRIARDSEVLDLNSSYSYLLWCRDFSATSLVARNTSGAPVAFVTGYARPDRPTALVVWQIAVDRAYRGQGLAGVLLDALTAKVIGDRGIKEIETTVTPDNTASDRLFTSYAKRHGAALERETLFENAHFPQEPQPHQESPGLMDSAAPGKPLEAHQPEILYRIGPLSA